MRVARYVARHSVLFLFLFLALSPATVLAFNPPNPGGPGNHLGEYLHNPHLQGSQSQPPPGGGSTGGGGGVTDALAIPQSGGEGPNLAALPAFRFQPQGFAIPALQSASSVGGDAWWVVVLLAAFLAANVVLAVLYVSRAGNFVYRRVLRLVPSTA
ncbi:MAG TPA: hypothetical protein VGV88_00540 [Candidatus Dormibacteraeota bacterium]|nr:hypothetical protein [Candidatus Dormibacteraeota bacterium]